MKKLVFFLSFIFLLTAQALLAAQHDYVIDNQNFPSFRADLNNVLNAVVNHNSGATEPATKYTYMLWADTTAGKMKMWDGTAWRILWDLTTGAIDHGGLGGLADDDHTQYHTDARGDARYFQQSEFLNSSAGAGDAGKPVKLDAGGHIDATMVNDGDIDHTAIANIGTNTHAQIDSHLASAANPHSVTKAQVGLTNVSDLKQNLTATTAPSATDDTNAGYSVGSTWYNVTLDKGFVCLDATAFAAVWKETTEVNPTASEIKTAYESNADTNAFTDAEQTKLAGIETGATADQTGAEIKAAYEAEANTNAFTDAEQTKLTGIETGAQVNPATMSQAEAEALTPGTVDRIVTATRLHQSTKKYVENKDLAPIGIWDFSGATFRYPGGTTLPPNCTIKDVFFDTDATAGQNTYGCTALNTWTLQGDGSGGGSGSMTTAKESDVQVGGATITTLDFGAGFDLVETPANEINITLDLTEKQVNLATEVTGTLPDANVADALTIAGGNIATSSITLEERGAADPVIDGRAEWDTTTETFKIGDDGVATYEFFPGAHTVDTTLSQEQVEDFAGALIGNGTGTHTGITITYQDATGDIDFVVSLGTAIDPAEMANADFGDFTFSSGVGTLDAGAVSYSKIQNVSATDRILGRDTAGAGVIEEITPAALLTMIGVEAGATADQTAAEIKTAYESNANTNEFDDTEQSKLAGIEAGADVTDATNVAAAGAVMDSDISAGEGFLRKTGAGAYEAIKSNLGATTDPGTGNDNTQGYAIGSKWINVTLDKVFEAVDVSTGAAVWKELSAAGGSGDQVSVDGGATTDPDFVSTGDIDFVNTSNVVTATIQNDKITEAMLKAVDVAADEECLTYEATVGDFEWQACGGGGATDTTQRFPIQLRIPQTSSLQGNAFWGSTALTAYDWGHWEFVKDAQGVISGAVAIPKSLCSTPAAKVILQTAANATTGVTSLQVSTAAIADGESINPASLTAETRQDITVPATAYLRKEVSFTLTNVPVADDLLIVEILHDGTQGADTLAVNTLLDSAQLEICVNN